MTSMFRLKRPSNKLIATLLVVTVLAIVFFYRRPIAIKSIEHFAKPYGLYISCLDFSLDWRFNLNVNQACVTFPKGEILVRNAMWQPWSNVLSIEQLKVKHVEQLATDNKVEKELPREEQPKKINLPDALPKLSISSIEIDSFELLHPLHVSVNTISSNEFRITGDVNASVKIHQNTLVGNLVWSLSDLTKWIPQAQKLSEDNPAILTELALDESKIQTSLTFDGEVISADSSLDITSQFHVSNCPIDAAIKGNVLVDVDVSSFDISLDLTQLSNDISVVNCPLLQEYFTEDDLPQLSFVFPQTIAINKTHINLPTLQIVDKSNTHRSIVLNDVNYKTTGELEVSYKIVLKQLITTKQITAEMFDLQAQGKLSTNLSAQASELPTSFKITNDNNRLVVKNVKMDTLLIGNLSSEFSFHDTQTKQLQMKGVVNSSTIKMGELKLAKTSSDFSLSGASFNDLHLSVDNQFFNTVHPELKIQKITNHIDVNIKQLETLSFSGNSTVTKLLTQNINFMPINMTHTGQASLANITLSSQHDVSLENNFIVQLTHQQAEVKVQINQQDISRLQKIISQLQDALLIKEGKLSANIELTLPQDGEAFIATGQANVQGVSAKYQDYVLNNISYQTPLTFDSAGLQLAESTLHIDSIDAGVRMTQLEGNVIAQNSVFRLKQVQGEIFNGTFLLGDLWLDGREQQFNINIQHIDLAQVVALQQQPGIQITGNIDGNMPFIMDEQGIRIEDGRVSSLAGGKLTIIDNPSFDSIKVQQPELALLENLDFTQLESKVKFTPDGWVFFDFALQGINPDKKQSVNFNYSHQENIFSLLESIRLVKAVENKIEQKLTQGDKK
ncbi:YdbH domain-containing protein [Paraglaciecola sp. MB-3u-78]|uniref:intermembrane phospholipid transport protein YdbH family protein n=1 Tax=Paraglaciecola sp. MB-3u-78 TaxID=2058332 RepID=UPI000C33949C|nr:YdbH domain-containing protein [Paraglaciecola sp. MB-3u-78]PKG97221.1 hypothetical protein CXF95_19935 [Paraglaciecola sp. MB-3u-78]